MIDAKCKISKMAQTMQDHVKKKQVMHKYKLHKDFPAKC